MTPSHLPDVEISSPSTWVLLNTAIDDTYALEEAVKANYFLSRDHSIDQRETHVSVGVTSLGRSTELKNRRPVLVINLYTQS